MSESFAFFPPVIVSSRSDRLARDEWAAFSIIPELQKPYIKTAARMQADRRFTCRAFWRVWWRARSTGRRARDASDSGPAVLFLPAE